MEITETTSDGLKRELKVVIGAKELGERLSTRLDELKSQVRIKGFRPGKVPKEHLRKVYGRSVMAEVVQQAVAETSQKALSERDERPAHQPEVSLPEDKDEIERVIAGDADLAYTMSFEVLPKFEVADLSALALEKEVAEPREEDIERGLQQILDSNTSFVAKDGPAEDGDQVTIDFEGRIEGEPFEGGKAEDAALVIGRGRFIPGFEDGLKGATAGESRSIETTFPQDYPAPHLAGKTATFAVTVKAVAAPQRPQADDAFAASLGLESAAKLREAVAKQLSDELARVSRSKLKRQLLDALDKAHAFDLPATLVDNEFESIWRQVTADLERAGRSFEDEGTTEEKARAEYRALAERRVRLGLVLADVGEKNQIKVHDEEVQRALLERIRQFPGQEREVYEFYRSNPAALAELRAPIFEDKVVDYILELAQVTEKTVTPQELFKDQDDHDHGHEGHDHAHHHGHDHKPEA